MESFIYKIFHSNSALQLISLPSLNLSDISAGDEVLEFVIEHPVFDYPVWPITPDVSVIMLGYDISVGVLSLLDEQTNQEHKITGEIEVKKRWYNQEEMLFLIGRANQLAHQEHQQYRQLLHTFHEARKFVADQYNRAQIKVAAGKKVNTLNLLEQILEKLKRY